MAELQAFIDAEHWIRFMQRISEWILMNYISQPDSGDQARDCGDDGAFRAIDIIVIDSVAATCSKAGD